MPAAASARQLFDPPLSKKKKRSSISAFANSLSVVKLSNNEFHLCLDSNYCPSSPRGKQETFVTCAKASVENIISKLQGRDDYSPLFLIDSMMVIDNYAEVVTNDDFVTPVLRA
eukprot:1738299-Ditylum_brightwellii.AAC.1